MSDTKVGVFEISKSHSLLTYFTVFQYAQLIYKSPITVGVHFFFFSTLEWYLMNTLIHLYNEELTMWSILFSSMTYPRVFMAAICQIIFWRFFISTALKFLKQLKKNSTINCCHVNVVSIDDALFCLYSIYIVSYSNLGSLLE